MKTLFRTVWLGLAWCVVGVETSHADEALRRVQQSLRDQGFYYGPVDGSPGDATSQAIRRYQIRNGLAVNGQLDDETKRAIEKSGDAVSAAGGAGQAGSTTIDGTDTARGAAPSGTVPPSQSYRRPTVRPVPEENRSEDDASTNDNAAPAPRGRADDEDANGGSFRERDNSGRRPDLRARPDEAPAERGGPLPRGAVLPSAQLSMLFASTPFEFAPPPVQVDLLRRAQATLTRQGFYDGPVNGVPSPLVSEALSNYQGVGRLRKTGRLDVSTLGRLRLMPER